MSHLPLDARAILEYLNESGYINITSQQLKAFMKDLKKLIKYEEALAVNHFQNSTASYRAKINEKNGGIKKHAFTDENSCSRHEARMKRTNYELPKNKPETLATKSHTSTSSNGQDTNSNLHSGATSPTKSKNTNETNSKPKMWIRSKQSTLQKPFKGSDPVELYHFYQREWTKFRDQLPGENNHMELRWQIRNKLLGVSSHPQKKR